MEILHSRSPYKTKFSPKEHTNKVATATSNQQLMVGAEPTRWLSTRNLTEMSGEETQPKSISRSRG
jgi:hypothetical protein